MWSELLAPSFPVASEASGEPSAVLAPGQQQAYQKVTLNPVKQADLSNKEFFLSSLDMGLKILCFFFTLISYNTR